MNLELARHSIRYKLKDIRSRLGLQRQEMATKLDVSISTYVSWEQGSRIPKWKTIHKICEKLGMSISDILELDSLPSTHTANETYTITVDQKFFLPSISCDDVIKSKTNKELFEKAHKINMFNNLDANDYPFIFKVETDELKTNNENSVPAGSYLICCNNLHNFKLLGSLVVAVVDSKDSRRIVIRRIYQPTYDDNLDNIEVGKIILKADNPQFEDLIVWGYEVRIIGIVHSCIKILQNDH